MIHPALAPVLLALVPMLADQPVLLAQLTIHERIVVRVRRAPMPVRPVEWKERKGPKCVSPGDLAGVLIAKPGTVDMVMYTAKGGRWLRAKLDGQCHALDFYSGVYLKPGADGQVCARRDVIRARSGSPCGIASFKVLEEKK